MIKLNNFENLKFFEENEGFIKSIYDNRYKDTIYSIKKIGSQWIVYIIDEEVGFFQTDGYYSKKSAIDAIESGKLKKEIKEQYFLYKRLNEII